MCQKVGKTIKVENVWDIRAQIQFSKHTTLECLICLDQQNLQGNGITWVNGAIGVIKLKWGNNSKWGKIGN